ISIYHSVKGEYALEEHYLQRAGLISRVQKDKQTEIEIVQRLYQNWVKDPSQSQNMSKRIKDYLKEAEDTGDKASSMSLLNTLGTSLLYEQKYQEAIDLLLEVIQVPEQESQLFREDRLAAHSNLGQAYRYLMNYPQALEHLLQAYQGFREMKASLNLETVSFNIGEVYMTVSRPDLAEPFLSESLQISQSLKNERNAHQAMHVLQQARNMLGY
ncbi:MAG: tetratricopeptide repeat protein, partial [Bacteroidota bacterium]